MRNGALQEAISCLNIPSHGIISIACCFLVSHFSHPHTPYNSSFCLHFHPRHSTVQVPSAQIMKISASLLISSLLPITAYAQGTLFRSRFPKFCKRTQQLNPAASWSCTVPNGYTYDEVVKVTNTCGAGSNPYYHIFLPTDNQWACLQVTGHIYDRVNTSTACSPDGVPTIQYRLRKPVDGLMACGPGTYNGFVYNMSGPTTLCTLSGVGTMYQIVAPRNNLWSCTQLDGWTYNATELDYDCNESYSLGPTPGQIYLLQKPTDGLWGCGTGVYNGFTYDQIQPGLGISGYECVIGNVKAPYYHLRQPKAGLWACAVPSGWTYSQTRPAAAGTCLVGEAATEYLLS